jgi:hypothetical protein
VSPLSIPPAADVIDTLVPEIATLLTLLPQPPLAAVPPLRSLHSLTIDLLSTLSTLSDSLHMIRQTTTLAGRRLRSVREMLVVMKKDLEAGEEGRRWLEAGRWEERLGERRAARVCREVIGGFEEVCGRWRERLVEMGEVEAAAA